MSNAGSWLLVRFRTEASGACQFHDKYQIFWQHTLESELCDGEEIAIGLLARDIAGTAGGLFQDNPALDISGISCWW